jgi:ABC-2 type transport system ATP-binding protein
VSATAPVVEFDQVVKDYPTGLLRRQSLRAVAGVSFRVEPGEVVGLLGPNRAGKTTLVKLLLSLCRATAGRVARLGRPAADRATLGRLGYVHENQAFPRYLSAAALLEYYGALTLLPEETVRARAAQLLERVGLADRSEEPIARFSKGMVQRLGLAQALLNDPELLVLDEPSEGLDLTGRQLIRDVVAEHRQKGRSVLFVSHLLGEVEHLCDRLAVLVGGRLAYLGPVDGLTRPVAGAAPRPLEEAVRELYEQTATDHPLTESVPS